MEVWITDTNESSSDLEVSYDSGGYDDYSYGYGDYGYGYSGYDYGYGYGYGTTTEGYNTDGVNVNLFGYGSYTIDLSSGYYGTATNINAAYSAGSNVLIGNYAANLIAAGSGPSSLWGGADYANDVLVGGSSYDLFYCSKYEGSDAILNASSADTVFLRDVFLNEIIGTYYDGTTVSLQFNTGNSVAVACTDYVSPNFVLADGSSYRFNRVTASWQ